MKCRKVFSNTSTIQVEPMGFMVQVVHVLRFAIASVARFFFSLYYGNEGAKIPAITDDILKKPAVEVAKKIRNKEVNKQHIKDNMTVVSFF